jgi:hypothetical protein
VGVGGTSIPNGDVVGNTHIVVEFTLGDCSSSKVTIDKTSNFLDGGIKGEVADGDCPDALESTGLWPTCLESDLRVSQLLDSGHPVLRRSVAVIVYQPLYPLPPVIRTPINLLSFYVGDGNGFGGLTMRGTYNVAVVGDPLTAPTGAMCTPTTSTSILLGRTAAGLILQTCEEAGTHTMTTVLTREVGSPKALVFDATKSDDVVCSPGAVGGIAEYPDIAESVGKSSPLPSSALAGAAAGAVVLMGGAWYARRRWVR